jgi:hypothetical protein
MNLYYCIISLPEEEVVVDSIIRDKNLDHCYDQNSFQPKLLLTQPFLLVLRRKRRKI